MAGLPIAERWHFYFATDIYLPLSGLSRRWRRFRRSFSGNSESSSRRPQLREISWKDCTRQRAVRIWEREKANGNVRISELGILAALAADCADGSNLFEIGTFDGRTTLNLAQNSPARCRIHTLDLPPGVEPVFSLAEGERHMVDKPRSGSRYEKHRATQPAVGNIHQYFGDSAAFDYSPYKGSCSLVFVDGSHAYDYVMSDSRAAMDLVAEGGVVIWHDYGIWDDVTRALDELEQKERLGLRSISGTSLAYWRKA
jgi:hypothetical protein